MLVMEALSQYDKNNQKASLTLILVGRLKSKSNFWTCYKTWRQRLQWMMLTAATFKLVKMCHWGKETLRLKMGVSQGKKLGRGTQRHICRLQSGATLQRTQFLACFPLACGKLCFNLISSVSILDFNPLYLVELMAEVWSRHTCGASVKKQEMGK